MLRGSESSKMADHARTSADEKLVKIRVIKNNKTYMALLGESLATELQSPDCDQAKKDLVFEAIGVPNTPIQDENAANSQLKAFESLWQSKIQKIIGSATATATQATATATQATATATQATATATQATATATLATATATQATATATQATATATPATATATQATASSQEQMHVWTDTEERLLIHLRCAREEKFLSSKAHDTLWNEISSEMKRKNTNVTKIQLINKWKNLKKKYKEVIDKNKKTGNARVTWKFYEEFNEIYGNKASTHPSYCIDTSNTNPVTIGNLTSTDDLPKLATTQKRKRAPKSKDDIGKLLQDNNQDVLKTLKKHHTEKMQRMDRLLDVFENFVGKSNKPRSEVNTDDDDSDD
ncbi:uncharacterized protein [Argopecten irradians]|uniref:uncharacterized protein n=1 Tax=Argopecten irradians TaxID=31199 RepID=UPI00371A6696